MAIPADKPASVHFLDDLDPKLVEESNAKFEKRIAKIEKGAEEAKRGIDRAKPGVKASVKCSTDASIIGGCAAGKVALACYQPEVASVVNPLLGLAQAPLLKAKQKHLNPLIDSSVEASAKSSKQGVDASATSSKKCVNKSC